MQTETKQVLLKQPGYTLELVKSFNESGIARHAFVMHPTVNGYIRPDAEGITLLMGEGHSVSRRDIHYALYLFQRFHLHHAETRVSQA